jgi:purine-cytosine permease-like protein
MLKTICAALVYFALVLGSGFLLGAVRVPFLVPRIGERWAELAEMPIMATAIFFAAGFILRRFPEVHWRGRSLIVGLLALALAICAELGLAVALQTQTLAEYVGSRDKVSGSVYLLMLVVFALMPRLRLLRHG